MLFNNLAFLPGLAFFRRLFLKRCMATLRPPTILLPKGKNCSTASEVNDRFATNQNDISVEIKSRYESNTTYVRCFEVIYARQQNAILQPG